MRPLLAIAAVTSLALHLQISAPAKGVRLSDLTWPEAETRLNAATVVVVPIGAGALEHGPHLKLGTDLSLADYLARRVADAADVVIAPTLTYHRYPGLLEYPGSSSLSLDTARALTMDVVRAVAQYGPRRFYALVTAPSTGRALDPAAQALAQDGILLVYTDIAGRLDRASSSVRKQAGGGHADEVETSMMLYIDPVSVDMKRAARDFTPGSGELQLVRRPALRAMYSPSGVWGDATLATAEKGRVIVQALVAGLLDDIETVRRAPLPAATRSMAAPEPAAPPRASVIPASRPGPSGCTSGDERTILGIGEAYSVAWANANAEALSLLWSAGGDVMHPDGFIERTRQAIRQNRAELFQRREYRGSRYPLTLRNIRCVDTDVAVVDGKWELRGVSDASGKPLPIFEGLCTLVVKRYGAPPDAPQAIRAAGSGWLIEAFRYTQKPTAVPLPTWALRPGIIK
jgi:creatinine amidohydrolase